MIQDSAAGIAALEKKIAGYETLLSLSSIIVRAKNKKELMALVRETVSSLFDFTYCTICLVSEDMTTFRTFLLDQEDRLERYDGYEESLEKPHSIEEGFFKEILYADEPLWYGFEELMGKGTLPELLHFSYEMGVRQMVGISLYSNAERYGTLTFYSEDQKRIDDSVLPLLKTVAGQVSIALSNILANEAILKQDQEKEALLSFSNHISSARDKNDLADVIFQHLKKLVGFDNVIICTISEDKQTHSAFLHVFENGTLNRFSESIWHEKFPVYDGIFDLIVESDAPVVLDLDTAMQRKNVPTYILFDHQNGMREMTAVTLRVGAHPYAVLFILSKQKGTLSKSHLSLLKGASSQIAVAVVNILANERIAKQLEEINSYKEQLEREKQYLQEEVTDRYQYEDIVGTGEKMRDVFKLVSQVAMASTSVLLLGETGTGKELIARAIHNASPRREKLMVKVNCAALPQGLIESELFGHERGSFTGAAERRIGKFELANKGTLFLDEIGEMPLELQVKLLRAIQEKEIERLGGRAVINTDVRIIAATNRNLEKEVAEGRFRADLYYRLNVFPIVLPPLRERKSDIPQLALYFLHKYAKSNGKKIENISKWVMAELTAYHWPGNIRELEHIIERSILTAQDNIIREVHLSDASSGGKIPPDKTKTLDENERDYIICILDRCNGKVAGPKGAAEILDLHPSTLNSKIRKLGIKKDIHHK